MSLLLIEPPSALQQIGKTMGLSEIHALRPFGIAARLARADCGGDDLLFRESIQNEAMKFSFLLKKYLSKSFVSIPASQKRDAKQHHETGNSYAGQEKRIKSLGEISLAEWRTGRARADDSKK